MSARITTRLRVCYFRGTAALTTASAATFAANTAFASQGPGIAPGHAGPTALLAMAIAVYGTLAVVVVAGLMGAARHR